MFEIPDSFRLQDGTINTQHSALVDFVNQCSSVTQHHDAGRLNQLIVEFIALLERHYQYEEDLMKKLKYPRLEEHAEHHAGSLREVRCWQNQIEKNPGPARDIPIILFNNVIFDIARGDLSFDDYVIDLHERGLVQA